MPTDPTIGTKLDELLAAIRGHDDPRRAATEWKQAYRLLQKTDLPAGRVGSVVGRRDVDGLVALIDQLRAPASTPPSTAEAPDLETCNRALRAFRKRLQLTRLDDESQISSRNPLTKGEGSRITSIMPPDGFPPSVWPQLVRQNKLRPAGHGFYELVE